MSAEKYKDLPELEDEPVASVPIKKEPESKPIIQEIKKSEPISKVQQYEILSDSKIEELQEGETEVWYYKRDHTSSINASLFGKTKKKPYTLNYQTTHVLLGKIKSKSKETIFKVLNNWSQNGEADDMVKKLKTHTSMSPGDIVVIDKVVYQCAPFGWKKLLLK